MIDMNGATLGRRLGCKLHSSAASASSSCLRIPALPMDWDLKAETNPSSPGLRINANPVDSRQACQSHREELQPLISLLLEESAFCIHKKTHMYVHVCICYAFIQVCCCVCVFVCAALCLCAHGTLSVSITQMSTCMGGHDICVGLDLC